MEIITMKKACQGFLLASSAIDREGKRRLSTESIVPLHLDYLSPFCTNSSFTIEIALKIILISSNHKIQKSHKLNDLYKLLPETIRNNVCEEIKSILKINDDQFNTFLYEISDMFIKSRYFYEYQGNFMVRYFFLKTFMIIISRYAISDIVDVDSFFINTHLSLYIECKHSLE